MCVGTRRLVLVLAACQAGAAVARASAPQVKDWTVDGVKREAIVFSPAKPPDPNGPKSPLVFAFHGHGGNMQGTANLMKFQQLWPDAVVVYPQGLLSPSPHDPDAKRTGW